MEKKTASAYQSVRITKSQADKLKEVADVMPGGTVNGLVQDCVDAYLECEAPIWLRAASEARKKIGRKPAA